MDRSDCLLLDRQNISFLSMCSFFGGLATIVACARESSAAAEALLDLLLEKDPPTSCDRLWMLARFRRCAVAAERSAVVGTVDSVLKSRWELLACMVLMRVDRLLVKDGTSMDRRGLWSPVPELMVRLSVMDEAAVPTREVSKEPWRRPMSGEEKVDVWWVSGVIRD